MITRSIFIASALSAAALSATAGSLTVAFVQPERYTDASYSRGFGDPQGRAEVTRDIERHLQTLAERKLPAGDALAIEVLDVDLAGQFEPTRLRPGDDVRVVRDVASPHLRLRYTWSRGGQVLAAAEEQVADANFLRGLNRYASSDRLRYEKQMLDTWFTRRFASATAPGSASQ